MSFLFIFSCTRSSMQLRGCLKLKNQPRINTDKHGYHKNLFLHCLLIALLHRHIAQLLFN